MRKIVIPSFLMLALFCAFGASSYAANADVLVVDNAFQPQTVTINLGDTVTWTLSNSAAAPHTTTSGSGCVADGLWNSGTLGSQPFQMVFDTPGTYPYFCIFHCGIGMTGTVIVNAPSLPAPIGHHITSFPAQTVPVLGASRDTSLPIALGPIATGGDTLTIQVGIEKYAVPVDMYAAFSVSTDPQTVVNVKPDLSFQRFSLTEILTALSTGQLPPAAVPWMSNVTEPLNTSLFTGLAASGIPPGKYTAYLMVAPSGGGVANFDLYKTNFTVGVPITTALSGAQEVPAVTTTASATANFAVDFDTGAVRGTMTFAGLTSAATAAHFHQGAAGVNGPVILALTGGAGSTAGVWTISGTFSASDLAALRTDGLYLNIHSVNFPNGEIRGQVTFPDIAFETSLDGSQEVPATGSSASGVANYAVNINTGTVSGTMVFSGLTSAATAAHFHQAAAGANGPVILALTGGAGSTSGAWSISGTFAPPQLTALGSDQLYLNIHSVNFPNGEIRGQIYYPPGVPLP